MHSLKIPSSSLQTFNAHVILAMSANVYLLHSYSMQGTRLSLKELRSLFPPGPLHISLCPSQQLMAPTISTTTIAVTNAHV